MNLTDNLNNTQNEETQDENLQEATQLSSPPSTPLGEQMNGQGVDAAKMAATPNAKQGNENERLDQAAAQEEQQVNPQQQTAEDYRRTQNIQQQTLGKAEEEAKKWEDQMASAGSNAQNVSKLIMDKTQENLDRAENETYAKALFSDSQALNSFSESMGIPSDEIEAAGPELGAVMASLSEGQTPSNEDLEALRAKMPEGTDFVQFETELKKALNDIDVGDKLASDQINAEDVRLSTLMDEGLIDEESIRLFLGIDANAPLPADWEDKSMAELNQLSQKQAAEQAERLRLQGAEAGLSYDAGAAAENVAGMAQAEEELADSVQFGDKRMSVDDFLDDDRVSGIVNDIMLDESILSLEGEELDAALEEKFGEEYKANPDYYKDIMDVAKANKDQIKQSTESVEATRQGIEKAQDAVNSMMTKAGLSNDMFSEMTGLDFGSWDMSIEDLNAAQDILKEYGAELSSAFAKDPDFFKTLKKDPNQSWEEFAQEINDKLGAIGKGTGKESNFERAQQINANFDEEGNFVGKDIDAFMTDLFGVDRQALIDFAEMAKIDPRAKEVLDSLPKDLKDGNITEKDIGDFVNQGGSIDLDALQNLDLVSKFNDAKKNYSARGVSTIIDDMQAEGKSLADINKYVSSNIDKMTDEQKRQMYKNPFFKENNLAYDHYKKMPKDVQKEIMKSSRDLTAELNKPGMTINRAEEILGKLADPNSVEAKQMKLAGNTDLTRLFYQIGGLDDQIGSREVPALQNYLKILDRMGKGDSDQAVAAREAVKRGKAGINTKYMGHNLINQANLLREMEATHGKGGPSAAELGRKSIEDIRKNIKF